MQGKKAMLNLQNKTIHWREAVLSIMSRQKTETIICEHITTSFFFYFWALIMGFINGFFFFTYLTQQRIQSNDSCKTTAGIDWQLAVDEELREFQHHLQPTLF